MDFIHRPKNPLTQPAKECTAASNTTIFIVNELFITNSDIMQLERLENDHCLTNRSKWDGMLFKADNKSVSLGLVAFSGGSPQFNATARKEASDVNKLYQSLKVVIDIPPESIPSEVYCIRYYIWVVL